ncbi:MAG: hypothetical protein R2750_06435 [Bacteroidales bacterium]
MILYVSFTTYQRFLQQFGVNATPNSDPDFTTLQAAHDNASVLAVTLYLEGSTFDYGALNISKQLTIIKMVISSVKILIHNGISPSKISAVYCYAGCEGTKFTGCTFLAPVYLYTNNLTFERNYFDYTSTQIYSQANCSDILILGNYFYSHISWTNLAFNQTHSNILVANNFFTGSVTVSSNFSGI